MSDFVDNFDKKSSTLSFQIPNGGVKDFCNESPGNGNNFLGDILTSDTTPNISSGLSSTSPINSSKSLKATKSVKFSDCDQFYETFYQTPFVNEDDEIIEDTVHVDIESMISGDDCSSSHVSFSTLDKATAGSAFDTESFSDFPLRLSQVESEGPERFSMDLVIEKLMNFQISLQPKSGGATPKEENENILTHFEPSDNIVDDDDVLVDRRRVSEENEMMLELIRAASQSLIECFKPNRQVPDAEAEKKLREESMQMLLDGDDSDANTPAVIDATNVGTAQNDSTSSQILQHLAKSTHPTSNGILSAHKIDNGFVPSSFIEEFSTSLPVQDCATLATKEPVLELNNLLESDVVTSTVKVSPPKRRNEKSEDSFPPLELTRQHQYLESDVLSKGIALDGLASSSPLPDCLLTSSKVTDLAVCTVDTQLHSPNRCRGTTGSMSCDPPVNMNSKSVQQHVSSNVSESGTTMTGSSINENSEDFTSMSNVCSSPLQGRGSLGVKVAGKTSEDAYGGSKVDYPPFSVDEAAALWVTEDASSKFDIANKRLRGLPTMSETSLKESSSATTNPCDSRRPSLNVTAAPLESELDPNSLRVKPSRLAIPISDMPPLQGLTGAQSRRHERLNRHETVAIDMGKGAVRYQRWKLFGNILFLWLFLPIIFCVLVYGIIPYDYFAGRASSSSSSNSASSPPSLERRNTSELVGPKISFTAWAPSTVPWILIMSSASAIAVDIYSTVISEIEFGVVIWHNSPRDYLKVAVAAIFCTVAMQILSFLTWGVGHVRNWLAMIAVGSTVVGFSLYRLFHKKRCLSTISPESGEAFRRLLRGLFVLFTLTGVLYTLFTLLYSQFSTSSGGFIGFLLATTFPLLRILLMSAMEKIPCMLWGHSGRGLCAGSTYVIVLAMWHGVFLSLTAACVSSSFELVTLGAVEFSLQFSTLYTISKLPSFPLTKTQSMEIMNKTDAAARYRKEREMVKRGSKARKVLAIHPNNDIESPRNHVPNGDLVISVPGEETPDPSDALNSEKKPPSSVEIVLEGENVPTESLDRCPSSFSFDGGVVAPGPRTVKDERVPAQGDEAYETRLATLLGLTWLTGSITPIAFLVCATLLNVGPNRRLFSAKVNIWRSSGGPTFSEVSDVEVLANLSRLWSLSVFNRDTSDVESVMWSIPSGRSGVGSTLVSKMLCVSFAHVLMLVGGCIWLRWNGSGSGNGSGTEKGTISSRSPIDLSRDAFEEPDSSNSSRASKDLGGLMSALLEYQYNVIALSSVMTMAIILSVVFPWYGMNSSL